MVDQGADVGAGADAERQVSCSSSSSSSCSSSPSSSSCSSSRKREAAGKEVSSSEDDEKLPDESAVSVEESKPIPEDDPEYYMKVHDPYEDDKNAHTSY